LLRSLLLVGAALLAIGLVAIGLILGVVIVTAFGLALLVRRGLNRIRRGHRDPNIIEGEYTVVSQSRTALHHEK
jgi:hypothetical protein